MDVHHRDGGRFLILHPLANEILQAHVEREPHLVAGLSLLAAQLADHAAERVDLHLAGAGGAAQRQIVFLLDAVLADAKAGQFQERIVALLQLLLRDGGDIADDVGHVAAIGVVARLADIDVDAWQLGRVDAEAAHLLPGEVLAHRDRHEGAPAMRLAQHALHVMLAEVDQVRELEQRRLHPVGVVRLLGHEDEAVVLNVDRQIVAVAVGDEASGRRQQAEVDAVLLRQNLVALALDHLQVVEPRAQPAQQQHLAAEQQGRPPVEELGSGLLGFHRARVPPRPLNGPAPATPGARR
jgi:hypothetical protein